MKTGTEGINLIKSFEGCRLTAYKCPAGVWTIGYGHTGTVDGKPIKSGMKITQAKAMELLKKDLEKFEKHVASFKYNWTQNQFDALVSFAFNVGSINQLTANGTRTAEQIAAKIPAYNKAAGKVLAGLTKRRKAEQKLFKKNSGKTYLTVATKESPLICRKTASKTGVQLGKFAKGTKVELLQKSGSWYKVTRKGTDGKALTGYCSAEYLK